jgi:hypothetical protein
MILTAAGVLATAVVVCAGAQSPGGSSLSVPVGPASLPRSFRPADAPDVVEEKPGTCPLCRMALVPVRLESVWSCPCTQPSRDRVTGVPDLRTRARADDHGAAWTCKGRPDIDVIEPARCPMAAR